MSSTPMPIWDVEGLKRKSAPCAKLFEALAFNPKLNCTHNQYPDPNPNLVLTCSQTLTLLYFQALLQRKPALLHVISGEFC